MEGRSRSKRVLKYRAKRVSRRVARWKRKISQVSRVVLCPVCSKPTRDHAGEDSSKKKPNSRFHFYCPNCGIVFRLSLFLSYCRRVFAKVRAIVHGPVGEGKPVRREISPDQKELNYKQMVDVNITPACLSKESEEQEDVPPYFYI